MEKNPWFRETTQEILNIEKCLLKWTDNDWRIFRNGRFNSLPVIEYSFLLFDVGFNPDLDSPQKASELLYGNHTST